MSSGGSASFIVRDGVTAHVQALSRFVVHGDKGVMREVADTARQEIFNRTATGKDINDRPFTPYSKNTLKRPEYRGKRIPDLDLSGRMLESLHKQVLDGFRARLFFQGQGGHGKIGNSMLARVHQYGMGNEPERAFFGLSARQRVRVKEHAHQVIYDRAVKIWKGRR